MSELINYEAPQALTIQHHAAAQQAVAEVQASMMLARAYPRDERVCLDRIMVACQRQKLAETAIYAYARGGSSVTGPSIRLAEEIKRIWGHIDSGWRVLESDAERSRVEAYCRDYQTGTIERRVWEVKHERVTKKGSYMLTDSRDIYELIANQAARRVRACILAMIPQDIIDSAVEQCEQTLKSTAQVTPDTVAKMVEAFGEFGVNKSQIEARIQRRLDAITSANYLALKKIYLSLRDGMSAPEDWFEAVAPTPPAPQMAEVPIDQTWDRATKARCKRKAQSLGGSMRDGGPALVPTDKQTEMEDYVAELMRAQEPAGASLESDDVPPADWQPA